MRDLTPYEEFLDRYTNAGPNSSREPGAVVANIITLVLTIVLVSLGVYVATM